MEVLILQVFVSLVLVLGSIILFSYSAKQKDHQHAGRLALLPLEGDPSTGRERSFSEAEQERNATEPIS